MLTIQFFVPLFPKSTISEQPKWLSSDYSKLFHFSNNIINFWEARNYCKQLNSTVYKPENSHEANTIGRFFKHGKNNGAFISRDYAGSCRMITHSEFPMIFNMGSIQMSECEEKRKVACVKLLELGRTSNDPQNSVYITGGHIPHKKGSVFEIVLAQLIVVLISSCCFCCCCFCGIPFRDRKRRAIVHHSLSSRFSATTVPKFIESDRCGQKCRIGVFRV